MPKTEKLMKAAGKIHEPVTYEGAGHGFMRAGEQPDAEAGTRKPMTRHGNGGKELLAKL